MKIVALVASTVAILAEFSASAQLYTETQMALTAPAPTTVEPQAAAPMILPGGTEVALATLTELNSAANRQGDRFALEVSKDISVNGVVVIPRGAKAVGEITEQQSIGPFGRSGRLGTRVLYLQIADRQIRLKGQNDLKGKSGAASAVAVFAFAGGFAALVKGGNAVIPAGSPMAALIDRDVFFMFSTRAVEQPPAAPVKTVVPKTTVISGSQ